MLKPKWWAFFLGGGGGRLGKVMRLSQIVNPEEKKKLKRC